MSLEQYLKAMGYAPDSRVGAVMHELSEAKTDRQRKAIIEKRYAWTPAMNYQEQAKMTDALIALSPELAKEIGVVA